MKPINELSGRELDAAVHGEVMGGRVFTQSEMRKYAEEIWAKQPSCRVFLKGFEASGGPEDHGVRFTQNDRCFPRYSSGWDAAREVVKKILEQRKVTVQMKSDIDRQWMVCIAYCDDEVEAHADTLPTAICRAALAWARRKA